MNLVINGSLISLPHRYPMSITANSSTVSISPAPSAGALCDVATTAAETVIEITSDATSNSFPMFTTITLERPYTVEVDVSHTSLTTEQIRILSAMAFFLEYVVIFGCESKYSVEGNVMSNQDWKYESLTWEGDHIWYSDCGNEKYQFAITVEGDHTIIKPAAGESNIDQDTDITLTFKDGLLDSIGDRPAMTKNHHDECLMVWFQAGCCYRAAEPSWPSHIRYGYRSHSNAQGQLHRDLEMGPAVYSYTVDGIEDCSIRYFLNGTEVELKVKHQVQLGTS